MNQVVCADCSRSLASGEAYELNGRIYCGPCVQKAAPRAKESGQPAAITRYVDKSICARCNTYLGENGGIELGSVRLCAACATMVQDWPYPQWLKMSLAVLLLLLVFALVHGRMYFEAGTSLYRGEQLVEKGKYQQALPYLKEALKIAPNSDKGALLTAKAALLSGDVLAASQALEGHNGGKFEKSDKPEFREVNDLWSRANRAIGELEQASKLEEQEGNEIEAAKLAHSAAALYPELPHMDILVDRYDEGVAFTKKDYDAFVSLAEKDWNVMPVATTAASLASALACKYAVTGDAAFRQRSEEMVAKSKELAQGDKESLARLAEFEERNRYRLQSRQIITKSEYDRKFRSAKGTAQ
jgi:tetratricopeptide (TPR) repeat protein